MKKYLLILLVLLLSCRVKLKTLDAGKFTIEVPSSWEILKERGIDSFVGKIVMDKKETVSFDLGRYSNSLDEKKPYYVKNDSVFLLNEVKSKHNSPFYEYYGRKNTTDLEKFSKNKVSFEIIDNRRFKIIRPKKAGQGLTGVYVDSLWVKGFGIDKFQLNGKELKPENEKKLLNAIRTIKFKE